MLQSLEMAKASGAGIDTAIQTPAYGMKRSSVASRPHSSAFGMPMKYSAMPNGMPNSALTTSCMYR